MRDKAKGIALMLAILGVLVLGKSQIFSFGFSDNGEGTMNLQTFVISDFGDEIDREDNIVWAVRYSDFAVPIDVTEEGDDLAYNRAPDPEACNAQYHPGKPLGLPESMDQEQNWCLGIKAQYIRNGYNYIEIVPTTPVETSVADISTNEPLNAIVMNTSSPTFEDDNYGEVAETNLNLTGVVQSLDLWLWGGNYDWWLEFHLKDYQGYEHQLEAGDISYIGWMNLRTTVPSYIPQSEHYVPFMQNLKIEKLKLWQYPTERIDQFFVYLDYMQVQTDVYVERFNGDDLSEPW